MAKNISPLMARENEVHGLIAWSVFPTRILFYLATAIGCQQLIFGVISFLLRENILMGTWQTALSSAFFFMAWQVSLFSKESDVYVKSESNEPLAKALNYMGGFWSAYQLTLFFSVAPLIAYLVRNLVGIDYQDFILKSFLGIPALLITIIFSWTLSRANRFDLVKKTITQYVEWFANKNLSRTRGLTFISIGIGILWIWAYIGDALMNTSLDNAAVALSGAAYLLMGAAVGFVWRAVREIQRNPSLIYFERTIEKINFFWLCSCIGFLIILVGNFF
ncbi:MAG: hypothetical protein EBR01_01535 [Proteobacteria bacterium]|nr:hypothetical protein [Pseudomonadota bacterium]